MVTPLAVFEEICDNSHAEGLPVHLDGARVFNAAVALGIPVARLTAKADTVMFCLSKGLGAPVGSLLVGSAELIDRGRIVRKALGGGMRQAGILAAAGLIALEQGPAKLKTDHANAKFLAEGLAQIPGIKIDPSKVDTNILICDITGTGMTSSDLSRKLAGRGVLANGVGAQLIRFVTHLDVNREAMRAGGGGGRVASAVRGHIELEVRKYRAFRKSFRFVSGHDFLVVPNRAQKKSGKARALD